jgi:hypothetical protein
MYEDSRDNNIDYLNPYLSQTTNREKLQLTLLRNYQ